MMMMMMMILVILMMMMMLVNLCCLEVTLDLPPLLLLIILLTPLPVRTGVCIFSSSIFSCFLLSSFFFIYYLSPVQVVLQLIQCLLQLCLHHRQVGDLTMIAIKNFAPLVIS